MKQPKLKNGAVFRYGALIIPATKGNTMAGQREAMQRSMQRTPGAAPNTAAPTIARTGQAKVLPTPATTPGMKRQTTGDLAPYHHGVAVDDAPNIPFKTYEKPVAIHPSMTLEQKTKFDPLAGPAILEEAGRLGRKA